ncbi:MAG: type II and III secretion system protein family protein [Aestuariivirga sp.]|uniref:type II and III secretion system protein family protein n=1 Tax=Aestuariivirga sp. TaxID=2650926 RepID=UPI0038D1AB87
MRSRQANSTGFRAVTRRALAVVASAWLAALCTPALHVPSTLAADDELAVSGQSGRFLRLGLSKSAVVKLPTAAKDVIVGDPEIVDVIVKNRNTAYMFARKAGQTNIFFLDPDGQQILQLDLEVTLDTKALKQLLDRSIPGNRIEVDSTGPSIVLKGRVADAMQGKKAEDLARRFMAGNQGEADSVVNLLTVSEGDQVMLKVRVVELKRSLLKELGINLENGKLSVGNFNLDFSNIATRELAPTILEATAAFTGPVLSVDATIKALETNGLATVLAEPTLTAVSGAPARFRAGGEYPYQNCEIGDNTICNTEFKNYGISLDFTPTVLSEDRIALNIHTQVSDLAENSFGTQPVIDSREAQTSLEMPSGGSMMIAGLIRDTTLQRLRGTPGLKALPVVGTLFSSRLSQSVQTELVVIVTPYIVGPTGEKELATPLERYNTPSDLQQIFLGRLNRVYGLPEGAASVKYHGQVGHIVE